MATAVKNPKKPTVAEVTGQLTTSLADYLALGRKAAILEEELRHLKQQQEPLRAAMLSTMQAYPALLNGSTTLALAGGKLALRKSTPALAFTDKYKPELLVALLKKHGLESKCVTTTVKGAEVVKACGYIGKLPVELANIGVTVADTTYSLVVTALAPGE